MCFGAFLIFCRETKVGLAFALNCPVQFKDKSACHGLTYLQNRVSNVTRARGWRRETEQPDRDTQRGETIWALQA